ncbi:hypothetical protein AeNC1_005468 [Aphanomyces euteiches]|nr:hypothetical protein AeNC1_005468 [Aphanomyces euteiches]
MDSKKPHRSISQQRTRTFADASTNPAANSSLFYRDLDFFDRPSYEETQPRPSHTPAHETIDPEMYSAYYDPSAKASDFDALPQRRKSSIEMFLSRSPSQHLGSDFFRMTLDEPTAFNLDGNAPSKPSRSPSLQMPPPQRFGSTNQYEDVDEATWYREPGHHPQLRKDDSALLYSRTNRIHQQQQYQQQQWQHHHQAMNAPPPLPTAAGYGMMRAPNNMPSRRFPALLSPDKPPMLKQCKFFAQGHCRMGNKCKFAHITGGGGSGPGSTASSYDEDYHPFGFRVNPELASPSGLPSESPPHTSISIDDIQGRVFAMSKDQNGCRLLQEQLEFDDRADLCDVIYAESLPHLVDMMVDPFGNYLFQKLLERVSDAQRLVIVQHVSFHLVAAALNLHGTRSVQKVVEICASSSHPLLIELIVDALKEDAVRLCIDSNGNHVIQRALQFMPSEYNQFVFDAVCAECTVVGTHRHGCCVLQRCVDAANASQKKEVIAQVEKHAMKLMQDPYGNYVVQYVLDACLPADALGVMEKCVGHIFELSIQKFSSNVIEKCLELAPDYLRQTFVKEIIASPRMYRMLQDQYANYVVQRALSVASEENCLQLVAAIRPHLASMKNTQGGRRIQARILKRFPHLDVGWDPDYGDLSSPAGPRPMNPHGSYGRVA